jgi:NADPH-dependent 2,4-dienoyl-CoA reductase/sulfur reductase-like enzyme
MYDGHVNAIHSMKVIIVGGMAEGATCAERLRRLDENAGILLLERGPFVSDGNCDLPYHISGLVEKDSSLFPAPEPGFKAAYGIDCRANSEVIGISVKNKTIQIQNLKTDAISVENYDKLVLSPGAEPILPPFPGMDLPGIFSVRTVPDSRSIREWLNQGLIEKIGLNSYTACHKLMKPEHAVVVGGGLKGLQMAENLIHLGLDVTLIEKRGQLIPHLDPELAKILEKYIVKHGVKLELNEEVTAFEKSEDGSLEVITGLGKKHPADLVILAFGAKPETRLAKMAGIEIGMHGGIRVDKHLRSSNPDIFAIGDAIEIRDFVTGHWTLNPLAGPANRQGRIAADVIAGRNSVYPDSKRTTICKVFEATFAQTGPSEKFLVKMGIHDFEKICIYPDAHAAYFPGAGIMAIKVIFRKSDGRLLGAQIAGEEGVAGRIDSFASKIQMGCTLYDLEEAELSFAQSIGTTVDTVDFEGMFSAGEWTNNS